MFQNLSILENGILEDQEKGGRIKHWDDVT